jgi:hypothetical protein
MMMRDAERERSDSPQVPAQGRDDLPFGVVVIAAAQVLNAVAAVLRVGFSQDQISRLLDRLEYFRILDPIFGLIGLAMAVGLLSRRRWAWVGTMLWAGASMAVNLVAYYHDEPHYISLALSVVAVLYLNLREVQIAFLGHPARRPGRRD